MHQKQFGAVSELLAMRPGLIDYLFFGPSFLGVAVRLRLRLFGGKRAAMRVVWGWMDGCWSKGSSLRCVLPVCLDTVLYLWNSVR